MVSRRYALVIAGAYALLATIYIVVSSAIAARLSVDVDQMRRIETLKGVLYVVVTAIGVFLASWAAMARLERSEARVREREAALVAGERHALAGLLAATTAHDANNVLVGVIADLDALHRTLGPQLHVARLEAAVERLIALNRRLMDTVRHGRAGDASELSVLREVRGALELVRAHRSLRECRVSVTGDENLRMRTHPLLVHQVLVNLVVNAGEATGGHGRVTVDVVRENGNARIDVDDDGPGIAPERRPGLFDALQTTKPDGSGLGLYSTRACVRSLGGTIEVGESPLGGARFRVRLPALA